MSHSLSTFSLPARQLQDEMALAWNSKHCLGQERDFQDSAVTSLATTVLFYLSFMYSVYLNFFFRSDLVPCSTGISSCKISTSAYLCFVKQKFKIDLPSSFFILVPDSCSLLLILERSALQREGSSFLSD